MALGIWNQLDEIGLYLGLDRLSSETDEAYFKRIKLFSKWRYETGYKVQAHSIPLQVGLQSHPAIQFECDHPFEVVFDWEYLTLTSYPTDGSEGEFSRVFVNINESIVDKILTTVSNLSHFHVTLLDDKYRNIHNAFLLRGKNTDIVTDYVDSHFFNLASKNIIDGSFHSKNEVMCRNRKKTLQTLKNAGDYFIDEENGYLQLYNTVNEGFYVTYKCYTKRYIIETTELNLIPYDIIAKYGITDDLINTLPYVLNDKVWGK